LSIVTVMVLVFSAWAWITADEKIRARTTNTFFIIGGFELITQQRCVRFASYSILDYPVVDFYGWIVEGLIWE